MWRFLKNAWWSLWATSKIWVATRGEETVRMTITSVGDLGVSSGWKIATAWVNDGFTLTEWPSKGDS